MQNSMTDQMPLFALVPFPVEVLEDAGIELGLPLQLNASKGRIMME